MNKPFWYSSEFSHTCKKKAVANAMEELNSNILVVVL